MRHLTERMEHFGKKTIVSGLIVLCLTLFVLSIALAADAWNCPECGRKGNTGNYCGGCGHASPYPEDPTNDSPQEKDSKEEFKTVGNIVTFGRYEQDNKTENGPEEIEWIVLDYDEKEHKSLLLSKYGLDAKRYNEDYQVTTWSECTLRTWLNDSFLNTAFTAEERNAILLTDVDNSSSQGYDGWSRSGEINTRDKVFLLSYAEANKYLGVTIANKNNMQSRVSPTAYAIKQGAYTSNSNNTAGNVAAGWWWLRSPDGNPHNAACVGTDGSLRDSRVNIAYGCVYPALWINLESGIF